MADTIVLNLEALKSTGEKISGYNQTMNSLMDDVKAAVMSTSEDILATASGEELRKNMEAFSGKFFENYTDTVETFAAFLKETLPESVETAESIISEWVTQLDF